MAEKRNLTDHEQDNTLTGKFQKRLRGLFWLYASHPSVQDIGESRRAQLLNIITLTLTATFLLALLARPAAVGTFIFLLSLSLVSFVLGKTKYHKVGAGLFTLGFLSSAFLPLLAGTAGSFETSITTIVPIALIVASALLGQRELLIIAIYATLATFLAPYYSKVPTPNVIRTGGIVMVLGAILYGINVFRASIERARLQEVRDVNRELAETQIGLEQRVADRTAALSRQTLQLQAAAEVSRAVSSVLDADELIGKAVNLVRDRFDLYYVGLFMLDEQRRFAVLCAGTGEAGHAMLTNAHKLEINDDSMIGWCITHKEARIALNTDREAARFNNPLLPETRSELALPLISQEQVIGAITVQSTQESAFSSEDITILQSMADQLAGGIEKARLYEQVQQRAIELYEARDVADIAKDEAEKARRAAEEASRILAAQMWQTTGQAALNEKMRGEQDISTLARNVIQHLCKYLSACAGAIYILEDKTLQLTGVYAYRRKSLAQQYQLGEDLVGQAAVENEIISTEIPDDYIAVSLRQGKLLPKYSLIVPLVHDQQVSGVVALESMTEFTPAQKHFLEEAIESVAIAFISAQARARADELFSQTRRQAEELRSQEEELRAANEELEAQTESLRALRV